MIRHEPVEADDVGETEWRADFEAVLFGPGLDDVGDHLLAARAQHCNRVEQGGDALSGHEVAQVDDTATSEPSSETVGTRSSHAPIGTTMVRAPLGLSR